MMDLDGASFATAVDRLASAAADRVPCGPVRELLATGDMEADLAVAYRVSRTLLQRRIALGARPVGRKIGLTNPKVQHQLGVDRPDFGVLLDEMRCQEGTPVNVDLLLQPKIEAEIAFVLRGDLAAGPDGAPITESDVAGATDYVVAALEIVDSRIGGWDIAIVDTVADNASSGLFVLGRDRARLDHLDVSAVSMTMTSHGEVVSAGTGADCLGSPLSAVAWLANTARELGAPLRAGEIVLSGALGPMAPVEAGSSFVAEIHGVGIVSVAFSGGSDRSTT